VGLFPGEATQAVRPVDPGGQKLVGHHVGNRFTVVALHPSGPVIAVGGEQFGHVRLQAVAAAALELLE
jgi:hypothetical protein